MISKDAFQNNKLVSKKVKTTNNSKGGNPIDVSPSHGRDLFEQAFVLQKMVEFKENLKKDWKVQNQIAQISKNIIKNHSRHTRK